MKANGIPGTLAFVLPVVAFLCGSGCASVGARMDGRRMEAETGKSRQCVYPGVCGDCEIIAWGAEIAGESRWDDPHFPSWMGLIFVPYGIVDLPLSFALDTVCLPYDIWVAAFGDETSRSDRAGAN